MTSWLTASQIAALKLPGWPSSKAGVLDLAVREGWRARPGMARVRRGRGGGEEFSADLLPAEARSAATAAALGRVEIPAALARAAAQEPEAAGLTVPAAENRDARLTILIEFERFRASEGLSPQAAELRFCRRYNAGGFALDPWVRQAVPVISIRTLARWRAEKSAGRTHRLGVDQGAKRRGKGALEAEDIRTYCLALIAKQPHLSSDHVRTLVADKFPGFALPAPRTFRLALRTWRERYRVELCKITNPDAFKNKYRLAGVNAHPVSRLNELWMIDASPADVLTLDGRHAIYACLDLYSRRVIVTVTTTPRAEAVGVLMRRAIHTWGLCERLKTDNGADFVAKASKRLFASLGIEVDTSTPFAPWEKGEVERVIKTFQHDCATLLPGFCGHNVADRKVIEARKAFAARLGDTDDKACSVELTAKDLQAYADGWAATRYAHRPHDGLGGVTPFAAAAGYVGTIRSVDVRALDMLLVPVAGSEGIRTVSKRGIRVDGSYYLTPTVLPDTRVLVRMDPADMGRALLFAADGESYLGEAVCPELAGIDPAEAVARARAEQARILKEGTADIRKAMREIKPRDMIDGVLRQAAKDAGVLVEFPRASVAHTTPSIEAAAEAANDAPVTAQTFDRPEPPPAADFAPNVHVLRNVETPQQRFRRFLEIKAVTAEGGSVDPEDVRWLVGYADGSECRAMTAYHEDFGEAALR